MSEYKKAGSTIVRVMSLKPWALSQYKRNANRKIRSFLYDRYVITIQMRGHNPKYPENDWRRYRKFQKIPILFRTEQEAKDYFDAHGFKNINGRKMSASVSKVKISLL
uniref:Uncharacterized protein n=1 Tax=Ochrobactrum phage ORM_20 TaxID=2985243 RepID=A0A9N6ZG02_9VIRU|nr:hypothetical protein ORM20_00085 [Ochrobactrum phage ORM_20]